MHLTPTVLRQLLAIDAALSPIHTAIACARRALADHHDLEGVADLDRVLARFSADVDACHPVNHVLADLKAEAGEPDVLPLRPVPPGPDAIDLTADDLDWAAAVEIAEHEAEQRRRERRGG
jgi:hypothetical protein